jgi:Predicted signal transduction protein with a C-terminal ATPase domain
MNQCIDYFRRKYSNLRISLKITLFYLIIFVISIIISSLLYQQIYMNLTLKKVSDVSIQTLDSINSNIDLMIDNINNYSKMILSNDDLQDVLRKASIYSDFSTQRRINAYLVKLMEAVPAISSVYIIDNSGNKYAVGNTYLNDLKLNRIEEAVWYQEIMKRKGSYILRLNGGGVFKDSSGGNFVSLIRVVNDIEQIKPIGTLIVNISENAFKDSYRNIVNKYRTNITILDENNQRIVKSHDRGIIHFNQILKDFRNEDYHYKVKTVYGKKYLVSYLQESRYNWKIISVMPFKEFPNESETLGFAGFVIILVNSLFLFWGSIFITKMITIPINKLLKSMKGIEKGEFKEVVINAGNDEIGRLRDGYNIMISEIQTLIDTVVQEQKIKRQAELDVLQAQVKPHFLYNTLDSINSLAFSGKNDEVCEIVEALGSYYRTSLSKGKEVITIGEEINMVKNYLKIQKIRYREMFSSEFEIEDRVNDYKILKLVLQPIVENALYHGIRAKGENGVIKITAKSIDDYIYLTVQDDGAGMNEETIKMILDERMDVDGSSFGVRGTIGRLRLFYGVQDVLRIESRVGYGTKVTIRIPTGQVISNA